MNFFKFGKYYTNFTTENLITHLRSQLKATQLVSP